jgi:hypothetical protein
MKKIIMYIIALNSISAFATVNCEVITVPKNDLLHNDVVYLPGIKYYAEKLTVQNEQECIDFAKAKLDDTLEFGHKVKKVKITINNGSTETKAEVRNL